MNNLTTSEISSRLRAIRDIQDPCERVIALKNFEPEYKHSQFYKITKKPLQMLYYEIVVEDLLTLNTTLHNLQQFINDLDASKIAAIFDEVNAQTLNVIKEGVDTFVSTGLQDLLHTTKR